MSRRRTINPIGMSFLDAMTCGLGAVVLLYMVINASVQLRADRVTVDRRAEADRLEEEVLEGNKRLVEVRNSVREVNDERVITEGLSRRLIEALRELDVELATFENTTLAQREHINKLKTDIKTLEDGAKRLAATAPPSDETPGDRTRAFIGDGDRQYLTGLKVGGERILFLVDASASMLDETIVNIVRRRNLSDEEKRQAEKWQQAVATVDWLTTQIPRTSSYQVYIFNDATTAVLEDTQGQWLDGSDGELMNRVITELRQTIPGRGTSLISAFSAAAELKPVPDNITLLTDGLPTVGKSQPRGGTVSARQRGRLFERATRERPANVPINVVLFPMEGDPMAASAFWKLALATRGSFMGVSEDWP
jgi:hypothetical protein